MDTTGQDDLGTSGSHVEPGGVPDGDVEVLAGGVGNAGAVLRVGDHVLRPTSAHSPAIHALLRHLREVGFDGAPELVGLEGDRQERLRFEPGDVALPPYPGWAQTDASLASTARLLRHYHQAVAGFVPPTGATWSDELADPSPGADAVICHNDICPENVVFRGGEAVVLLDFEFAAPGRRVFDVASLARMCAPIDTEADAARNGWVGLDPAARVRVVADAYGLAADERAELIEVLAAQFATRGAFVRRRVEAGEPAFVAMWEEMGGQARYDRRHQWFETERERFLDVLTADGPPGTVR